MSRLPKVPQKTNPKDYFMKIGLQVRPDLHEKMKAMAFIENRHQRDILSDAILLYAEKKHPDIEKKMEILEG